jgi:branched-chain amino acid transport system ATP-binding protein
MLKIAMLKIDGLAAAYGLSQVLFDVALEVARGEVVGLLGRNGMGKTTTIRSLFGLTRRLGGVIEIENRPLAGLPPHKVAALGLTLVPEGRQIFPNLTAEENLVATTRLGSWTLPRIYDLFPRLAERRRHAGNALSGGEQQMLAIGRALLTNPKLLILDEATEGLAPLIRADIWRCLRKLKAEGQTILITDPNLAHLLDLADRHVILENGRTVWSGSSTELRAVPEVARRHLAL